MNSATTSQFISTYLDLCHRGATGTLKLSLQDGRQPALFIREGGIGDMDPGEAHSILALAILATGKITGRELRKAQKRTTGDDARGLGSWLFGLGRAGEDEILEKVQEILTERICELFTAEVTAEDFIEHKVDERIEGFNSELSEVFDLIFDGEDFFIEACRRQDRWDLVQQHFAALADIFYATPAAMKYYNHPEGNDREIAVLKDVDGFLDLGEIINKTKLPPFESLLALRQLMRDGAVKKVTPVEIFQLGNQTFEKKQFEKARKIFKRALEQGLGEEFDVQFKLAESCEALQRHSEAAALFKDFAEKCQKRFRIKQAAIAFQKAVEIEPLDLLTQQKLLQLLLDQDRKGEALVHAMTAAESLSAASNHREALDLLLFLRGRGLHENQLHHKILELAQKCGDDHVFKRELAANPTELDKVLDLDKALETYQRLFCEGNHSLEIRLKLVELHTRKGNQAKALEHINGILETPLESQIGDLEAQASLHETRLAANPGSMISARWLVDYHIQGNRKEKALSILQNLIRQLEERNEVYLAVEAIKLLAEFDAESFDPRWQLANLYARLGKPADAIAQLEQIALLAQERKDDANAKKAWIEILKAAPFFRRGLMGSAEYLERAGDGTGSAERLRALLFMEILCGNFEGAEDCCRRVQAIEPDHAEAPRRLGEAFLAAGDRAKGVPLLLLAAITLLKQRDLGSVRVVIDRVLSAEPGSREAAEILKRLEAAEAPPAPRPPAVQAPPAGQAPPAVQAQPAGPSPAEPRFESYRSALPAAFQQPPGAPAAAAPFHAAAPAEGSPAIPSRPPTAEEAFQGRAPITKGAVSAITARLRSMKSGGSPAAARSPAPEAAAGSGDAEPAAEASTGGLISGVKGLASKLKALASSKGKAAPPAAGELEAQPALEAGAMPETPAPAAAPEAKVKVGKPGSVAIRKDGSFAIKKGEVQKSPAKGSPLDDSQAQVLQKAQNAATVQPGKALGSSASKLAALRARKAQPVPQEEPAPELETEPG